VAAFVAIAGEAATHHIAQDCFTAFAFGVNVIQGCILA
jgi:hypothetical protein